MPGSRRSPTGTISPVAASRTIWILGDQLNLGVASLDGADPGTDRILMIRSEGKAASKPFHPLRLRLVQEAMGATPTGR
jgi:deoxyribodipyrimidine photolyase-like uncharacterized protein